MSKSVRLAPASLNFKDANANSLLKLDVDSAAPGTARLSTNGGGTVSISGIGMPTESTSIASKAYCDSVAQGLTMKGEVAYVTVGPLVRAGGSFTAEYVYGDAAHPNVTVIKGNCTWDELTSVEIDIGPSIVDGLSRSIAKAQVENWFETHTNFLARPTEHYYEETEGDASTATTNFGKRRDWPSRILVNAENDARMNGIYWLKHKGSATDGYVLVRTDNFDGEPVGTGEVHVGCFCFIGDGHKFKNKGMCLQQDPNDPQGGGFVIMKNDSTVGNRILFDGFSAMGYNSAGNNISISGDEISTVTNPRFDVSAEIACLTLSAHTDSGDKGWIQCTQGVFFESNSETTIEANKNIVSAKTI